MRKFKHILVFLLLTITTVIINGGTRAKCSTEQLESPELTKESVMQGFPDLVSFANFINQ